MTYEAIATLSQVVSLLMFVAIFLVVVGYALWPGNKPRFEVAQRRALDLQQGCSADGGQE